ncbi:hypothetical protein FA15DRAFT_674093 [Coprinopsis marcescibilis]|uniref:Uncharacterized protein n=1 Tax=Coprinopsis marcescibilis TaxID=230819 RepID=A0A5C3KJ05_COPMA|nr:hypothetical protein FA15DRAFT_674093 [Coprinopsis marcescibilis]
MEAPSYSMQPAEKPQDSAYPTQIQYPPPTMSQYHGGAMQYAGQYQAPLQQPPVYHNQYPAQYGPNYSNTAMYNPVKPAPLTREVTSRAKALLGLLYTVFFISAAVFGLSMVHLGILSLFLSPAISAATLIYSFILIIVTHVNFKRIRQGKFLDKNGKPRFLGVCRAPAIVFAFLFLVPWIGNTGVLGFMVTVVSAAASFGSGISSSLGGFGSSAGSGSGSSSSRGGGGLFGAFGSSPFGEMTNTFNTLGQIVAIGGTEAGLSGIQFVMVLTLGIVSAVERSSTKSLRRRWAAHSAPIA